MKKSVFGGISLNNFSANAGVNENFTINANVAMSPLLYGTLNDEKLKDLKDFGYSDLEQVYSALIQTETSSEFCNSFQINPENISGLVSEIEQIIPKTTISKFQNTSFDQYFIEPLHNNNQEQAGSQIERWDIDLQFFLTNLLNAQLSSGVNQISGFGPVKNQGQRGTCTAFSTTAANEYRFGKLGSGQVPNLSEQFLYFVTKTNIDKNEVCGSFHRSTTSAINIYGQCLGSQLGYNPNEPCFQNDKIPDMVYQNALNYRSRAIALDVNNIQQIKAALFGGHPVLFSIPVFNSWFRSVETNRSGRLTLPLKNEQAIGGHAMVMAGYQDAENAPGGGFFIFRNSWSTQWANSNVYGAGYGLIPYEYISQYNAEAFILVGM